MSVGPVTPSKAELVHHLASAAIHLGGWTVEYMEVAGASVASWPLPTEPPPGAFGNDSGVWLRTKAGEAAGSEDLVVIRQNGAGNVELAVWRSIDGTQNPHDGAAGLVVGAAATAMTLTALAPGTYGDAVVVTDYGIYVAQVGSDGVVPGAYYAGHFVSSYRLSDGSGAALGDEPLQFPLTILNLKTASGVAYLEDQVAHTVAALGASKAPQPYPDGTGIPPRLFSPILVGKPYAAPPNDYGSCGIVPYLFQVNAQNFDPEITHLRGEDGAWYVGFLRTLTQMVGPADQVVTRVLTYGGPLTL